GDRGVQPVAPAARRDRQRARRAAAAAPRRPDRALRGPGQRRARRRAARARAGARRDRDRGVRDRRRRGAGGRTAGHRPRGGRRARDRPRGPDGRLLRPPRSRRAGGGRRGVRRARRRPGGVPGQRRALRRRPLPPRPARDRRRGVRRGARAARAAAAPGARARAAELRLKVAAVVPNHNGRRWLDGCLRALAAQTRPFDTVLVVDDGSTDGSREALARDWPAVRVLALGRRRGFAAAANEGLAAVAPDCDAVALVNPDVELAPDRLARTAAALEADAGAAAVASKMVSLREPGPPALLDDC